MKLVIKEVNEKRYFVHLIFGLAVFLLIVLLYFFVERASICEDFSCFQASLTSCKKTMFIRDDTNYIWRYDLTRQIDDDFCDVKVSLLALKKGNIDLEPLQGTSMNCKVIKTSNEFPESDLQSCNGELREGIQELMVQRIHTYILQNVDQIGQKMQK